MFRRAGAGIAPTEHDWLAGRGSWIALPLATLLIMLINVACVPLAPAKTWLSGSRSALVAPTPSPTALAPSEVLRLVPSESPPPGLAPTATPTARTFVYFFPVQPPEITSYAPGVESHGYPAIDIFAPLGAPFVAVMDGVVDFVSTEDSWDPATDDPAQRGGLAVAIIGDDGMRYYGSHLSAVEQGILPGVRVRAGEVLGRLGSSGNARGKDVHLHFGISHPTYPEDWQIRRGEIDPFPYLEAWRIEIYITPHLP